MMERHRNYLMALIPVMLLLSWVVSQVHRVDARMPSGDFSPLNTSYQSGSATRSELILAMNTLRVSNGLPALIEDPIINSVAQATADTMAANNMSWHIGDVRGRIAAAGYGGGATVWATENFAVGHMGIDEIMQAWADPEHMRPAVTPAYCHVGAGVSQAADGRTYYILQAAYTSTKTCGEYKSVVEDGSGTNQNPAPPVISQIIIPVKVATPDTDGRIFHIVRAGQSFWSIAIAYQITIRDLEVWNNLSREVNLYPGQKLFIPSSGTEGYATPTPVGMVILSPQDADGKIVHEVQPYQTLITIADAYNVSVNTILSLNGLQADWPLQIGQKLLIDPGNATPSPTPRPLSAVEQLTPASDGNYYHTVESGENLAWIAELYEIGLSDLLTWNGLDSNSIIRPGQQLILRVTPPVIETPSPEPQTPTSTATQTVVPLTSTMIMETLPITENQIKKTSSQPGLSQVAGPFLIGLVIVVLIVILLASRKN